MTVDSIHVYLSAAYDAFCNTREDIEKVNMAIHEHNERMVSGMRKNSDNL